MAGGSFLKPNRTPTHIFKNNLSQYNENASSIYQYQTSTASMLVKTKKQQAAAALKKDGGGVVSDDCVSEDRTFRIKIGRSAESLDDDKQSAITYS